MEKVIKIIRSSTHAFFTTYNTFASIATVFIFPASAATLLSKSLPSSTLLQLIPCKKSKNFSFFHAKLFQLIFSFLLVLPFTLSFLCLAKSSIIRACHEFTQRSQARPSISKFLHLYRRLAFTEIFASLLILSTSIIFSSIMFLVFDAIQLLGLDSRSIIINISNVSLILYSTIIANTFVISNLASIVVAMENCSSYTAIIKAFELVRDRALLALSLALPANSAMAAIEAVFRARVVRPYHESQQFDPSLICEAFTITYMYSIFTVLNIIITCTFYRCP